MVPFLMGVLIVCILVSPKQNAYAQGLSFPAEINKSFTPISIPAGGISRLMVTIYNPNDFQLTNATWTDNLVGVQPGLSIASPVNLSNSCGGTATAIAGATTLSLSGGVVPAQAGVTPGSCTVAIGQYKGIGIIDGNHEARYPPGGDRDGSEALVYLSRKG